MNVALTLDGIKPGDYVVAHLPHDANGAKAPSSFGLPFRIAAGAGDPPN